MGKLIRCLTRDATVMALFLDSTDMVARPEQIHQPSAVMTGIPISTPAPDPTSSVSTRE